MNWIYQLFSFFAAFGPVVLGVLLWHVLWNGDSGSDDDPPGGTNWSPEPEPPRWSGDRSPRHGPPVPSPQWPVPKRS
ncbi:hypothetical protein [Salisaeta longa]|uniref:hypothetical protein n=1 Tax=Salisaeta longa TaxID=503170 RepID=UPI0003B5638C|nr:hypothetical protein [Salisaeta longa]